MRTIFYHALLILNWHLFHMHVYERLIELYRNCECRVTNYDCTSAQILSTCYCSAYWTVYCTVYTDDWSHSVVCVRDIILFQYTFTSILLDLFFFFHFASYFALTQFLFLRSLCLISMPLCHWCGRTVWLLYILYSLIGTKHEIHSHIV